MKTYFAVVDKDQDSAFGLWFPDVPGCFSAADDEADILRNAIEALELHLEGEPAPDARQVDVVARDPSVADALANGAYLLAVPLVQTFHRAVRVNLSLDRGILEAIDSAAKLRGLTRSGFLAEAARNEIEGPRQDNTRRLNRV